MPLKTIIAIGETEISFAQLNQWLVDYRIIPILNKDWDQIEAYSPGLVLYHAPNPLDKALKRLSQQKWLRKIPTLLIHSNTALEAKQVATAYRYGIMDCLHWPTDQASLLHKVKSCYRPISWLRKLCHYKGLGRKPYQATGFIPASYPVKLTESSLASKITTTGLYVQFFGSFQLYYNQKALPDHLSKKNKNLLAYLLYHQGKFLHRDKLMDLFWPQVMPDAARNSLHVAISHIRSYLRKFMGNRKIIKHQNEGYLFAPDCAVITDVQQFRANCRSGWDAMKSQKIEAAVPYLNGASDLYRLAFLREFLYEEWCTREREALQEALLAVLKSLAIHYHSQGAYEKVIPLAERMLLVAPFLEDIHRLLISCFLELNMRGRALNQYQKCRSLLMSHFEVEPSPETQALVEDLRNY